MPTLNWIGKDAVVKHHKDVPSRLLEPVPELSCPPILPLQEGSKTKESDNLIVQGDNLHALKTLRAGSVKMPHSLERNEPTIPIRETRGRRRNALRHDPILFVTGARI